MKPFEKEKISVRFGEHTLCEGPAEMMCGWMCEHCGAWQVSAPVTQDKLQKHLKFTLKPRGHWTKEPPTKEGWYFVYDGRPKRPLFACVDRRIGDNELIFNCLGWAHDCKLEGQTIIKWWWSEPLELPELPEEESHAEI